MIRASVRCSTKSGVHPQSDGSSLSSPTPSKSARSDLHVSFCQFFPNRFRSVPVRDDQILELLDAGLSPRSIAAEPHSHRTPVDIDLPLCGVRDYAQSATDFGD